MSTNEVLTRLKLPPAYQGARHALTSIPWPAERKDFPSVVGIDHQIVPLFEPALTPRLRRYLLLAEADSLPAELEITTAADHPSRRQFFSDVAIQTLRENLDRHTNSYVYSEREAQIAVADRKIGLRLGLLPNANDGSSPDHFSWWQWTRAERMWSGQVAEAWRIGGHLVPYTVDAPGQWTNPDLTQLGDLLNHYCGDILHGDVYLIVWRTGLLQLTAHFKSAYFHTWPKPVPGFPVIAFTGLGEQFQLDLSPSMPMFSSEEHRPRIRRQGEHFIIQPWTDLRLLANKTRDGQLIYLPPERPDTLPAGVCRTVSFHLGPTPGFPTAVARYHVPASWYRTCKQIDSDHPGPAAQMASRCADAIIDSTQQGGIDTGRVWRYLKRAEKLPNRVEEDGAEWEGNLAQAMFTLAYQRDESPDRHWHLYLHHAQHAADVSVYHGSWMGRLECTAAFTAPLPKFRFGGFLYAYLETGDPTLIELARSVAGVYMAMEWALQPRSAIGRDAYPLTCLMALWDYTADPLYLDFARQTATRLLSTQQPDGGFSSQAGAGVLTGVSARPGIRDIHFGSGILSPFALLEWAIRDRDRWPDDFLPRLRKWADLMLNLQKEDGHWYVEGKSNEPYTLTGSGTLFTLIKAGEILNDPRCKDAVRRYLKAMNDNNAYVLGTHAFLSAQYAHVADAALE